MRGGGGRGGAGCLWGGGGLWGLGGGGGGGPAGREGGRGKVWMCEVFVIRLCQLMGCYEMSHLGLHLPLHPGMD